MSQEMLQRPARLLQWSRTARIEWTLGGCRPRSAWFALVLVLVSGLALAPAVAAAADADGDGLPDEWEQQFGLNPASVAGDDGADGDPDADGATNLQEYVASTHPRGFYTRYLAEGATSDFFSVRLALLNPSPDRSRALLRFQKDDGSAVTHALELGPMTRGTVYVNELPDMAQAQFSTIVESDIALVVDRTMAWDKREYGSHAETSIASPARTWYLAEGATHSGFNLFYLIQNPNAESAEVHVTYMLPAPQAPILRTYSVAANARFNIWVDTEGADLANTDVSAVVSADVPIVVERAMYLDSPGTLYRAGHDSAGVTQPATEWFLAEGATGDLFDLFVLLANPTTERAEVTATFLLPDGNQVSKPYSVGPQSRFTVWVDLEDARLASTALSTIVTSTNGVPIVVERAMWWPGPTPATWAEAHSSAGMTATGPRWALAEGEVRSHHAVETYVLIANRGAADTARVTLVYEDGTSETRDVWLPANSRTNVTVSLDFPKSSNKRFGALVEALGPNADLFVEWSMYSNSETLIWEAGTNACATRLDDK